MCPWCRGRDSQQHWMTDCTEARLVAGRAAIYTSAVKYLKKKSKRFEEVGQAVLEYAAGANHGNRVLLGLWEGDAMDWLARRMAEIPGDGTTEAQLERFMLSFHRHLAMDVLDLWEVRSTMLTKHRKEAHSLTLASLRQEVAEEEAAELVGDTLLLLREGDRAGVAEAEIPGASVGTARRVRVPARVYDSWPARLGLGSVGVGSSAVMENTEGEGGGIQKWARRSLWRRERPLWRCC